VQARHRMLISRFGSVMSRDRLRKLRKGFVAMQANIAGREEEIRRERALESKCLLMFGVSQRAYMTDAFNSLAIYSSRKILMRGRLKRAAALMYRTALHRCFEAMLEYTLGKAKMARLKNLVSAWRRKRDGEMPGLDAWCLAWKLIVKQRRRRLRVGVKFFERREEKAMKRVVKTWRANSKEFKASREGLNRRSVSRAQHG
jgi:hypothetical protein